MLMEFTGLIVTYPPESVLNKGPPAQIEGDQVRFRSKGNLYSWIKEWRGRGAQAPFTGLSLAAALFHRPWAGLLFRVLLSGEGWSSHGRRRSCTAHAPDHSLGAASLHKARHRHLELSMARCWLFCTQS